MEPTIPPEAPGSENSADEQLVDGLLRATLTEDDATHRDRIASALAALDKQPESATSSLGWRIAISAAAALVVGAVFWLQPNPDAAEIVDAARIVSREAGDRRYAISVQAAGSPHVLVTATMDIRDPDHVLVRITHTGDEDSTWIARNGEEQWIRTPEGVVRPLASHEEITHWLGLRAHAEYLTSLDRLLEHLGGGFELTDGDSSQLAARPGQSLDHVVGLPSPPTAGKPSKVDLWVDETRVVQRVVIEWGLGAPTGQGIHAHPEHGERHGHHGSQHGSEHRHAPAGMPHTITFDLTERRRFPDRWFEPTTHK